MESLVCGDCLEQTPRILCVRLSCGESHALCRTCALLQCKKDGSLCDSMYCPICKSSSRVVEGHGWKSIEELEEFLAPEVLKCDECSADATHFCHACGYLLLCHSHSTDMHKFKAMQSHKPLSLVLPSVRRDPGLFYARKCSKHPDQNLQFFLYPEASNVKGVDCRLLVRDPFCWKVVCAQCLVERENMNSAHRGVGEDSGTSCIHHLAVAPISSDSTSSKNTNDFKHMTEQDLSWFTAALETLKMHCSGVEDARISS